MSSTHAVVQGEYLSGIAKAYGFANHATIWEHPQNAALKKKRQNPNVLFPGDQVFIPDKDQKQALAPTGLTHRFKLSGETLQLRLVLENRFEKPVANAQCTLRIGSETSTLTSNGEGKIEKQIPAGARSGSLTVSHPQTPVDGIAVPIAIGDLDPVEERSGQVERLNNLGYFAGPLAEASEQDNEAMLSSAIEEFQCEHGLGVDGKCGPLSQAKLKKVHGC